MPRVPGCRAKTLTTPVLRSLSAIVFVFSRFGVGFRSGARRLLSRSGSFLLLPEIEDALFDGPGSFVGVWSHSVSQNADAALVWLASGALGAISLWDLVQIGSEMQLSLRVGPAVDFTRCGMSKEHAERECERWGNGAREMLRASGHFSRFGEIIRVLESGRADTGWRCGDPSGRVLGH